MVFNGTTSGTQSIEGIRNLKVLLRGGNDALEFRIATSSLGDVQVNMGSGHDCLNLRRIEIQSLIISTGAGNDMASVTQTDIAGPFRARTGSGRDILEVSRTSASEFVPSGGGIDDLAFRGTGLMSANASVVGGRVSINTGAGDDDLLLESLLAESTGTISTGAGRDHLTLNIVHVRDTLTARLGGNDDAISMPFARFDKAPIFHGGGGFDTISGTPPIFTPTPH